MRLNGVIKAGIRGQPVTSGQTATGQFNLLWNGIKIDRDMARANYE